ncbi:hypothetical protein L6452_04293 [Arctium lappa]|uniref:Uncharacterized protein n=1 Tax=Arctium lappa TaxID=4217 RepID=A0ACB9FP06_ARCLA|nr:hypothetical protein L6452_04293 [Arctium lappa]
MADENVFEVEMVNHEDDSTLIISSPQICSSQLVDFAIEEARNNKKTLISEMDSVIGFMREVECEEKAAELAKDEAAKSSLQVLAMVDELKQAQQLAKETNAMYAREVYAQKAVLATELEELQLRVSCLLDDEDISLAVLDEMRRALETRLASALIKKELADKEKLENEKSFREALAYQESEMAEVVEESYRLKQEASENSKLQEFLIDRGHVVDMLNGEISDKCRVLRKEIDFVIPQIGSSSSLTASRTSYEPQFEIMESYDTPDESTEQADSDVSPENSSGFLLVDSALLSNNSSSDLKNQDQNGSECRKCRNSMNGIKRRIKVSKEKMILNTFRIKNLKNKAKKKWIEELIMEAVTGFCQDDFFTDYRRDDFDDGKEVLLDSFFILILVILNLVYAFWK